METTLENYTVAQRKYLLMKATVDYQLIANQLYKLGVDKLLKIFILQHEREGIMREAHEGTMGGNYARKMAAHKIMHVGLWRLAIFRDTKEYCKAYDICQRVGNPSKRDEIPLNP